MPSRASAELPDAMQEDLEDTQIHRRTRRRVVPSDEDLTLTQKATRCLHQKFYDKECWPRLSNPERALMRTFGVDHVHGGLHQQDDEDRGSTLPSAGRGTGVQRSRDESEDQHICP